jgi:hypothetical protein
LAWVCARLLPRRWIAGMVNRAVRRTGNLALADAFVAAWQARLASHAKTQGRGSSRTALAALSLDFAEGRFDGCRISPDAVRAGRDAAFDAFLREAGRPWRLQEAQPLDTLELRELSCVILFRGADARAVLPWLPQDCAADIIVQDNVAHAAALSAARPRLTLAGSHEIERGFSPPWFAGARRFVEAVIAAAPRLCPARDIGAAIAKHRVLLVNRLSFELIREIAAAENLAEQLQPWRGRRILLVEGETPVAHVAQVLAADGHDPASLFLLCGSSKPSARLAFVQRQRQGLADTKPLPQHGARMAAAVASYQRHLAISVMPGCGVVAADFRNRNEFRYLKTAHSLISALAPNRRILVLQQYNRVTPNLLRVWRRIVPRSFGRARLAFLPSPQALRLDAASALWGEFLVTCASGAALPRSGLPQKAAERVAAEALRQFGARYLLQALAIAGAVEAAFRRAMPAYAVFIPDMHPFAMAAASGARAAGVPTLAVQTLMIGQSSRDFQPVCEYLACIDATQAGLYANRFGIPPEKIVEVGYTDMSDWLDLAAVRKYRPKPGEPKRAIFVTQPLPGIVDQALQMSIEAVARLPCYELSIYTHPSETKAAIERYRAMAAASGCPERIRLAGSGTPIEAVLDSHVVINVASNIGYKAAQLGATVIVADPTRTGLPVRFHEMGIALHATDTASMFECLQNATDGGDAAAALDRSRAAYLAANPQLTDGRAIARIAGFLERLAASASQQDAPL